MRVRYSFSSRRTRHIDKMRQQRPKYPDVVAKIIELSDIIIEVLDARFIQDTRNIDIEYDIRKKDKKILYVINKSDLKKPDKKSRESIKPNIAVSCKDRASIRKLRDKIKQLSKKIDKEQVTVGIIGYPNTGKSSIINLLIGKKSAGTGSDAGFTKGLQKLRLDRNIVLLDSPGVISKAEYSSVKQNKISKHTKLGARSYSQVREPEMVIATLIKEYRGVLEKHYKAHAKSDSEILLERLGKRWNYFKKGGIPDPDKTARRILKDWQQGVIKL